MKKIFLHLLLLVCGLTANAQGFHYGVEAGINLSHPDMTYSTTTKTRVGAVVGVRGEYDFQSNTNGLYISAALKWAQKGHKTESFLGHNGVPNSYVKGKVTLNYLELPIHIGYKLALSNQVSLFGEAGPYIGYAAWGKTKYDVIGQNQTIEKKVFDKNDGFKRFDAGVGIDLGVQLYKHYQVRLGYERGLTQIENNKNIPAGSPKSKYHNSNFNITLGYTF